MVVLAKSSNRMVKIIASESPDFLEQFNKHAMTPDRIKECEIAKELFHNETHKN